MDWLNYHHLLYFWTVAKEGTIVKACEVLHLSQPTISTQIQAFEKAIGHKLFNRVGRNLVLTEMGQMVFRYANDIFTVGKDLQDFLEGRSLGKRLRLSVGITDSLPKTITHRILEPLIQSQDTLQLICYENDNLEGLLLRLSHFELDLVLADSPVSPVTKIKAYNHLLGESGLTFFAAPQLAKKYQENYPACLHQQPFLLPTESTALRKTLNQWFERHKIRPYIVAEFDDMALLKVFGQEGAGIFCLPSVVEEDIQTKYGVHILGRDKRFKASYYAISIERKLKHPAIISLTERARQLLFQVI